MTTIWIITTIQKPKIAGLEIADKIKKLLTIWKLSDQLMFAMQQ